MSSELFGPCKQKLDDGVNSDNKPSQVTSNSAYLPQLLGSKRLISWVKLDSGNVKYVNCKHIEGLSTTCGSWKKHKAMAVPLNTMSDLECH